MAKEKIIYSCSSCDYQSLKWLGCCTQCQAWNSFVKEESSVLFGQNISKKKHQVVSVAMHTLTDITHQKSERICTGISEFDRVIGGGIVPGSLIILTGDPGIGKSTLLLQISDKLAHKARVFYFSSEESLAQVKQRAARIGGSHEQLLFCA